MSSKAQALRDDTAVSISAVYQPRSAKRKHIWHRRIPGINSDRQSESTSGTAGPTMGVYPHNRVEDGYLYHQRSAKRTPTGTAAPAIVARIYIRSEQTGHNYDP